MILFFKLYFCFNMLFYKQNNLCQPPVEAAQQLSDESEVSKVVTAWAADSIKVFNCTTVVG